MSQTITKEYEKLPEAINHAAMNSDVSAAFQHLARSAHLLK